MLTDQCFPAALPAKAGHLCPAIIRVEDGTLADIWACFQKSIGKTKLPVGSVIVLSSLSHLVRVGTAAYAADLQAALTNIEREYGNRVKAVHGLPVLGYTFRIR
jgi:hypothetical protein